MNTFKTLALFAALCAAASAFAQERVPEMQAAAAMPWAATTPRADVAAGVQQARRDGSLRIYDAEHHVPAPMLEAARPRHDMRAHAASSRGERRFDGNAATDGRG